MAKSARRYWISLGKSHAPLGRSSALFPYQVFMSVQTATASSHYRGTVCGSKSDTAVSRQAEEHNAAEKHRSALRARGSTNTAASLRDAPGSRSTEECTCAREGPREGAIFCCHFSAKQRNQLQAKIRNQKAQTYGLLIGRERSPSGFVPSGTYLGRTAVGGLLLAPGSENWV